VFDSLQALGLKLGVIALVVWPVAVGWLFLSWALGRVQERRATPTDFGATAQGERA
jgi:AAA family ATP:ADP antiporter